MNVIVYRKVQLNLIKLTLRQYDVKVFLTDRIVGIYFHFDLDKSENIYRTVFRKV